LVIYKECFEILGSLSKHAPLSTAVGYTASNSNKNSHGLRGNWTKHVGVFIFPFTLVCFKSTAVSMLVHTAASALDSGILLMKCICRYVGTTVWGKKLSAVFLQPIRDRGLYRTEE
jgi:hypothetical protein